LNHIFIQYIFDTFSEVQFCPFSHAGNFAQFPEIDFFAQLTQHLSSHNFNKLGDETVQPERNV